MTSLTNALLIFVTKNGHISGHSCQAGSAFPGISDVFWDFPVAFVPISRAFLATEWISFL